MSTKLMIGAKPKEPFCMYFVTLPDGRECAARGTKDGKAIVTGVAMGKVQTIEGTKTIWNQLEQHERFEIELPKF